MRVTIKEEIIRELLTQNYTEEEIIGVITTYGKYLIEDIELFNTAQIKKFKENNIIELKDYMNKTEEEISNILYFPKKSRGAKTRKIIKQIREILQKLKNETDIIKNIELYHNNLLNLVKQIKENRKLLNMLRDDIIASQNLEQANWIHSRLNLNKQEIDMLRDYLNEQIKLENIASNPNIYEIGLIIINIYNNLSYYIKKIQYKEIVDQFFYELETIGLTKSEQYAYKRNNIFYVSQILEYTEEELLKLPKFGNTTYNKTMLELQKYNIYMFWEKEKIIENLEQENAKIKIQQTKK